MDNFLDILKYITRSKTNKKLVALNSTLFLLVIVLLLAIMSIGVCCYAMSSNISKYKTYIEVNSKLDDFRSSNSENAIKAESVKKGLLERFSQPILARKIREVADKCSVVVEAQNYKKCDQTGELQGYYVDLQVESGYRNIKKFLVALEGVHGIAIHDKININNKKDNGTLAVNIRLIVYYLPS